MKCTDSGAVHIATVYIPLVSSGSSDGYTYIPTYLVTGKQGVLVLTVPSLPRPEGGAGAVWVSTGCSGVMGTRTTSSS